MPVIAMQVTSAQKHDKTDSLFIYTFQSPQLGERTIVANSSNVYEVGDVAAIAQLGTLLPDGAIKPRNIFGVASQGMALGKVDVPVDTELTAQYDGDQPERTFVLTFKIEVVGHYAADAEKAARKVFKSGKGELVSAEVV